MENKAPLQPLEAIGSRESVCLFPVWSLVSEAAAVVVKEDRMGKTSPGPIVSLVIMELIRCNYNPLNP